MIYQITVIDDHPIVSEGICNVLQQEGYQCRPINNWDTIMEDIANDEAQLYILDLSLPNINGFRLIEFIQKQHPNSQILVYTMHEESWIIKQLAIYQVQGAISKNEPINALTQAVKTISNGQKFYSKVFSELLNKNFVSQEDRENIPELSKRETEVLHLITKGLNTNEIAEALCLSVNTIHTYRKRLMVKLEAKNMAELVYKGKDLF